MWPSRMTPTEVTFEQLTFPRARIGAARFITGGRGVVYSEARLENPLHVLRIESTGRLSPQSLDFEPGCEILAVGASEIALSMKRRFVMGERFVGTLAIAPLAGGTPREIAEDIEYADWDPEEGSWQLSGRVRVGE